MVVDKLVRKERLFNRVIEVLSVLIPVAVALLFGINLQQLGFAVKPLTMLPPMYAAINFVTVCLLLTALVAVKNGSIIWHRRLIITAMVCSSCFLLMYVAYHMTSTATPYGGSGVMRAIYFLVLISHIMLSIGVVPLVLSAFSKGWLGQVKKHKKLVRFALPLWLYVAASGVLVYLMISPYYV